MSNFIINIKEGDSWKEVNFQDVKKGNIFTIFCKKDKGFFVEGAQTKEMIAGCDFQRCSLGDFLPNSGEYFELACREQDGSLWRVTYKYNV